MIAVSLQHQRNQLPRVTPVIFKLQSKVLSQQAFFFSDTIKHESHRQSQDRQGKITGKHECDSAWCQKQAQVQRMPDTVVNALLHQAMIWLQSDISTEMAT